MKRVIYFSKKAGEITIAQKNTWHSIYSQRLEARSLNQENESSLITQYTNLLGNLDNIYLFAEGKPWNTIAVKEFIQSEVRRWNAGNTFSVLSVYQSTTQAFIGFLQVKHLIDDFRDVGKGHPNVAEIIYVVDRAFWGKGYGTELAIMGKQFIKHLISESPKGSVERSIKEIVGTVHPSNEGSRKILENTLSFQEKNAFIRFNGQPRLLFYNPVEVPEPVISKI